MSIIQAAGSNHLGLTTTKEQGIFDIIRRNACSKCKAAHTNGWCYRSKERCESSYAEQAKEIYATFIQPYDDDLK